MMITNKVKNFRSLLGLTQAELARLLKVTPQTVSAKENGKRQFSDEEKIMIVKLVNQEYPDIRISDIFFKQKV
ncbi:helix-turn-helix transcriptional regulator [Aerococcus urinaeequi]|uniref:helix-turn-helix transcriptional regulator n=1 Tax=Aerococcus urinaeequi TaxID=51665 RepID=UPI003D6BA6F3